jgi:hypothetical protein
MHRICASQPYPLPNALELKVGDRILIGKDMQLRMSNELEPGRGKLER